MPLVCHHEFLRCVKQSRILPFPSSRPTTKSRKHRRRSRPSLAEDPIAPPKLNRKRQMAQLLYETEPHFVLTLGAMPRRLRPVDRQQSWQRSLSTVYCFSLLSKISPDAPKARCCNWT